MVGEVDDPVQVCKRVQQLGPDMVLLDWGMSGIDREQVLAELNKVQPRPWIVALSGYPELKQEVLELGAGAFVGRWEHPQEPLSALRRSEV